MRCIDSSGACADLVKSLEEADSETHAGFSDDDEDDESKDDEPSDMEKRKIIAQEKAKKTQEDKCLSCAGSGEG